MSEEKNTDHLFKSGNQLWKLRSKHGRDKIFATPEIMWEAICEYFQYIDENPIIEKDFIKSGENAGKMIDVPRMRAYGIKGLCVFLGVNSQYFTDFENSLNPEESEIDKGFSLVITRTRDIIFDQKFTGASSNQLNANIIARDLGLVDKQKTEQSGTIKLEQITGLEVK